MLGTSPAQIEKGSIFKKRGKPLNGWSEADKKIPLEYYEWCMKWAPEWFRVLKPGSSCFIFAGRRLAHRCICAMEDSGFIFKDMLAWEKDSAAYRAQHISKVFERRNDNQNAEQWCDWEVGNLRPLFEPILWFMKPYPQGSTLTDNVLKYGVGAFNETAFNTPGIMNDGVEMHSNMIKIKAEKSDRGLHPTQKPVKLMEFLISLTTSEGQTVLDPFCECGTTVVAAINLKRNYIGFEINDEYYSNIIKRINLQ